MSHLVFVCAVRVTERSQSSMGAMHSSLLPIVAMCQALWLCRAEMRERLFERVGVFPSYSHLAHYCRVCIPNIFFIHYLCIGVWVHWLV